MSRLPSRICKPTEAAPASVGNFRVSACAALEELWVDANTRVFVGNQTLQIRNLERLERIMLNIEEDHLIGELTLCDLPSLLFCGAQDGAVRKRVGVSSLRLKKLPMLQLFSIADEIETQDVRMYRCPLLRAIPTLSLENDEEACTVKISRVGADEPLIVRGGAFISELTVRRCSHLTRIDCAEAERARENHAGVSTASHRIGSATPHRP